MKMKNRIALATFACLLSLLALLVSCSSAPTAPATQAPGAAPATPQAAPTTAPAASPQGAATQPAAASSQSAAGNKPQYGGTLISVLNADPTNFDAGTKGQGAANYGLVYQQYLTQDWTKGPAGGAPKDFYVAGAPYVEDFYYPQLAESWKMPSVGVWVLEIRQGVHWQKVNSDAGRLMGGREVTADDVVSSLKRLLAAPKSWANVSQPAMVKATTVEKTGPWEVTIKTPVDYLTSFFWIIQGGGFNALYPPEVVAKYGDVADWHNSVGTGPFMLTDYTRGSELTFVKNPDYWETDPAGPGKGNKLPYVDTYKQLIISDVSTRVAAMRTGKIDMLTDATSQDAQSILKGNSAVQSEQYMTTAGPNATVGIAMNINNAPFKDKRVRQAMMLATDFNGLKQTLFGGQAEVDVWPVNKLIKSLYQPLSEMPQSVQDLYNYNPTKAKQLLAQAGYPNGFKANVATQNDPQLIDELSVFKDMWAKVGIDLTIQPMENAAFAAMEAARSNPQLIYRAPGILGMPMVLYFAPYRGKSNNNPSFIDDPVGSVPAIENAFKEVNQNVFVNWPKAYAAFESMKPTLLDGAYFIPRPTPYVDSMWWPWVKNYYGTQASGFVRYAWIDQKLKQSMGK